MITRLNLPKLLRRRINWLVFLLSLFVTGQLRAQLININFTENSSAGNGGPNPGPTMTGAGLLGSAGDHWNGISGGSGSSIALIHADGSASPVTLSFTAGGGYNVYNYGGTTPFMGTLFNNLMETYLTDGTIRVLCLLERYRSYTSLVGA